jgi:hypothetical protein
MDTNESAPFAWQPFTLRGVAAFARASCARLLFVQFLVAVLAAAIVLWFVQSRWFAIVSAAIEQLPADGEIRSGKLSWSAESTMALAENRFLSCSIDLKHEGNARSPADVQLEFGETDFKVISLFGARRQSYPQGWVVEFNRTGLKPWWGAWTPAMLALTGIGVISGLLVSWSVLATLYCWIAWLVGFFGNRDLSLAGSWRLAGAALVPGALFMSLAIWLYGIGALDLVQLLAAAALHFVIGWVYTILGPLGAPAHPAVPKVEGNPFMLAQTQNPKSEPAQPEPKSR